MTHGVGCKPVIYMLIGMTGDVPGVSGHFAPVKGGLMWCSESHKVAATNLKLCLHLLWAWTASHRNYIQYWIRRRGDQHEHEGDKFEDSWANHLP